MLLIVSFLSAYYSFENVISISFLFTWKTLFAFAHRFTSYVVVSGQRVGHQEAVLDPPRRVQLPAVRYQAVAQLVGRVQERVFTSLGPNVDGDVRDERVGICVFRFQRVLSQYRVRGQVEDVDGVRAHLFGRVACTPKRM